MFHDLKTWPSAALIETRDGKYVRRVRRGGSVTTEETDQGSSAGLSADPVCIRCDYGPNHQSDRCRGWSDPDEPCRNAEPGEYEEEVNA